MDLISCLESLPPIRLDQLYANSIVCQAVVQSLPGLASQYIARLLFLEDSIPDAIISSWATTDAAAQHEAVIAQLHQLKILESSSLKAKIRGVGLNATFRSSTQKAILHGHGRVWPVTSTVTELGITVEEIEDGAAKQWEDLLLFLVGATDRPPRAPLGFGELDVEGLLIGAGLMIRDPGSRRSSITEAGFQFLLMDTYMQLWQLLQVYISQAGENDSAQHASAIAFLLKLGLSEDCFELSALQPQELVTAKHMAQLGILVPFKKSGVWMASSSLASALSQGTSRLTSEATGFVITETNFRVYAYTSSAIQQSILKLFVRCEVFLPNLVVGTITRESVVGALDGGITADQIVTFLQHHAHPRIKKNVPIVPGVRVAGGVGSNRLVAVGVAAVGI